MPTRPAANNSTAAAAATLRDSHSPAIGIETPSKPDPVPSNDAGSAPVSAVSQSATGPDQSTPRRAASRRGSRRGRADETTPGRGRRAPRPARATTGRRSRLPIEPRSALSFHGLHAPPAATSALAPAASAVRAIAPRFPGSDTPQATTTSARSPASSDASGTGAGAATSASEPGAASRRLRRARSPSSTRRRAGSPANASPRDSATSRASIASPRRRASSISRSPSSRSVPRSLPAATRRTSLTSGFDAERIVSTEGWYVGVVPRPPPRTIPAWTRPSEAA